MISDWIVAVTVVIGAGLGLTAALGVARFPDTLTRMQAATKAGAVGLSLVMIGVAVAFASAELTMYAVLVIAFTVLTAPVAAHLVARAAYATGTPLWRGTHRDDLEGSDTAKELRRRDRGPDDPEAPLR